MLFTALEMEPFPVSEIPLTFINGLDGHSGLPHADSTDGRFRLSFLYYLHRILKAFRGGDLEIFETEEGSACGYRDEAVIRIPHEDNLLLAYTSETFHGVTRIESDSDDFADGRFVAVGFLGPQ